MRQLKRGCYVVLIFSFSVFYFSCISKRKVERVFTSTPAPFSTDAINAVYKNKPSAADQKAFYRAPSPTLWEILNENYAYFGRRLPDVSDDAEVSLTYLDNNKLKAVLIDSNYVMDSILLKAKPYKDYLSLNKVVIIPIPVVFFHFENIRILLSLDAEGQLNAKYFKNQFVEVILAGGVNEKSNFTFGKIRK